MREIWKAFATETVTAEIVVVGDEAAVVAATLTVDQSGIIPGLHRHLDRTVDRTITVAQGHCPGKLILMCQLGRAVPEGARDARDLALLLAVVPAHPRPAEPLHLVLVEVHSDAIPQVSVVVAVPSIAGTPRDLQTHSEESVGAESHLPTPGEDHHLQSVDETQALHQNRDAIDHAQFLDLDQAAETGMAARACLHRVVDVPLHCLDELRTNALTL